MTRLHLGLTPWALEAGRTGAELADQAELAEQLGYESFWLPESHFIPRGALPSPLLQLAAVASRTRRLKLGTTSYLLPHRHPLQVAEEVAVLDQLSGGRVILGVGRGFRRALFTAFDVPVAEKRDRFEAALAVMVAAWTGEPVAVDPADDTPIHLSPRPVQKPHPPLWVAAFGPKALAQAGRLGLPYLASPMEPMDRLIDNYARHRDAHDGEPLPVPVMRTLFATRKRELAHHVRDALERQAEAMRTSGTTLRRAAPERLEDWAIVGEPEAVSDGIATYRERLGMTHVVVRGGIQGVPSAECIRSLELIAELDHG